MVGHICKQIIWEKWGRGVRRRESEKKEEETSANYNVQQAKLQRRLRLSPATLKNDRLPALYRVRGLRIG